MKDKVEALMALAGEVSAAHLACEMHAWDDDYKPKSYEEKYAAWQAARASLENGLREAVADPSKGGATRSQKLAAAGFTPRDRRLTCDECGAKFTAQFAPLHNCDGAVESFHHISGES